MKKLIDMNIQEFLDELASNSPAPGGGSVAALAGALGGALSSMVCNLTLGKEKYAAVRDEIRDVLEKSTQLQQELTRLIDEDTNAFNEVIQAFKLPKETEEQKLQRKQAIQKGYKTAASIPLKTAQTCEKILDMAIVVADKGNQNSITDAGVSALMAQAGVRSALLNVRINLGSITDKRFVENIAQKIADLEKLSNEKTQKIMSIVGSTI
jgi:formiminotetrahydrofolate cyclodeaminase